MKKSALFSDGTKDYREPTEPNPGDTVTVRFRTGKDDVDSVWLCIDDASLEMEKFETEGSFDYYRVQIKLAESAVSYYFKVISGAVECFYDRMGPSKVQRPTHCFKIVPGFSTPDWAKGAVMYQILVDRFYNGDPSNDVQSNEYYYIKTYSRQVKNWRKYPEPFDVGEFYGGDLKGVWKKLDYLEELGVEVIYFNPLFVSPSNHKYDIQDYDYIDPHYGIIVADGGELLEDGVRDNSKATLYMKRVTDKRNLEASNQLFIRLVEEIHRRGMRVILDGVFNHCGSFNKWLDRERLYERQEGYEPGAYISADSPYKGFFRFREEHSWPYNNSYDGWWDHDTLPKLNYEESRELYDYILEIGKKWVSPPFNADGWRLDVAADLGHSVEFNHKFWRDFRKAVKEANPNALILAEHYGDPVDWLQGDQWDTVMNYDAFMEPLTWFLTGMEKHSESFREEMKGNLKEFQGVMNYCMTRFLTPSLYCSMNELSNHDHSRFLTRTNQKVGRAEQLGCEAAGEGVKKAVMKEAVVFQMTWPGAPTLYYGDEAGVCGFTDPDNRRTYPWGEEDKELLQFHRDMIRIHKTYEAFRTGSVKFLNGEDNLLCFGRFNRKEQFVILLNNDEVARSITVNVWEAGVPRECEMEQIMYTTEENHSMMPVPYQVMNGQLKMTLPGLSSVILKVKK
ncbi:MAG: glycoside hydrolase family 13 protein [Lachnospiraceae bacterium]|nr:glycoside hydrolase family 13 protein [Lachnospiraceae bacterium]